MFDKLRMLNGQWARPGAPWYAPNAQMTNTLDNFVKKDGKPFPLFYFSFFISYLFRYFIKFFVAKFQKWRQANIPDYFTMQVLVRIVSVWKK